jgi:hypothetical protein
MRHRLTGRLAAAIVHVLEVNSYLFVTLSEADEISSLKDVILRADTVDF